MAFNIVARNQVDHVENIAFLMDKAGRWSLSPAYDVAYNYNPTGPIQGAAPMADAAMREACETMARTYEGVFMQLHEPRVE